MSVDGFVRPQSQRSRETAEPEARVGTIRVCTVCRARGTRNSYSTQYQKDLYCRNLYKVYYYSTTQLRVARPRNEQRTVLTLTETVPRVGIPTYVTDQVNAYGWILWMCVGSGVQCGATPISVQRGRPDKAHGQQHGPCIQKCISVHQLYRAP